MIARLYMPPMRRFVPSGAPSRDCVKPGPHSGLAENINWLNCVQGSPLYVPSGYPLGATIATPPVNEHAPSSPAIRYYQRILLGTGFSPGPQGADGILGANTANAIQAWARWYNDLPEGVQAVPGDLKRGPMVAVDRALTNEKQIAMQRFDARASDVLARIEHVATTAVVPPAPIPWGTVALVGTAGAALLGLVVYAVNESSKKKAARS